MMNDKEIDDLAVRTVVDALTNDVELIDVTTVMENNSAGLPGEDEFEQDVALLAERVTELLDDFYEWLDKREKEEK